jgi:hypothetical protein
VGCVCVCVCGLVERQLYHTPPPPPPQPLSFFVSFFLSFPSSLASRHHHPRCFLWSLPSCFLPPTHHHPLFSHTHTYIHTYIHTSTIATRDTTTSHHMESQPLGACLWKVAHPPTGDTRLKGIVPRGDGVGGAVLVLGLVGLLEEVGVSGPVCVCVCFGCGVCVCGVCGDAPCSPRPRPRSGKRS